MAETPEAHPGTALYSDETGDYELLGFVQYLEDGTPYVGAFHGKRATVRRREVMPPDVRAAEQELWDRLVKENQARFDALAALTQPNRAEAWRRYVRVRRRMQNLRHRYRFIENWDDPPPRRKYIPKKVREAVTTRWEQEGRRCGICGGPMVSDEDRHIHHIRPVSEGGTNDLDNLCIAHVECNVGGYGELEAHGHFRPPPSWRS